MVNLLGHEGEAKEPEKNRFSHEEIKLNIPHDEKETPKKFNWKKLFPIFGVKEKSEPAVNKIADTNKLIYPNNKLPKSTGLTNIDLVTAETPDKLSPLIAKPINSFSSPLSAKESPKIPPPPPLPESHFLKKEAKKEEIAPPENKIKKETVVKEKSKSFWSKIFSSDNSQKKNITKPSADNNAPIVNNKKVEIPAIKGNNFSKNVANEIPEIKIKSQNIDSSANKFRQHLPSASAKNLKEEGLGVNLAFADMEFSERNMVKRFTLVITVIMAALALIILSYTYIYFKNREITARLETVNLEQQKVVKQLDNYNESLSGVVRAQKQLTGVSELLNNHIYWTKFLKFLEENTVVNIKYTEMSAAEKDGEVVLSLQAPNYETLAKQILAFEEQSAVIMGVEMSLANLKIIETPAASNEKTTNANVTIEKSATIPAAVVEVELKLLLKPEFFK